MILLFLVVGGLASGEVVRIDVHSAKADAPKMLQMTLTYWFKPATKLKSKYFVAAFVTDSAGSRFVWAQKPVELTPEVFQGEMAKQYGAQAACILQMESGTKNVQFGVYGEAIEKADCKRSKCEECKNWGRHLAGPIDSTSTMHLRDEMNFTIWKGVARK